MRVIKMWAVVAMKIKFSTSNKEKFQGFLFAISSLK